MVAKGRYYRLAPIITDIVKVLILVPQFQYIFNWTVVDSSGFIQSLREIEDIRDIEIILKFHPRHGRIEYYRAIMDLSRFKIQHGDNFIEILDDADIVVAFESSSALIDCILCSKPLVYINRGWHGLLPTHQKALQSLSEARQGTLKLDSCQTNP